MPLKQSNNVVWNAIGFANYTDQNTKAWRRFVQSRNAKKRYFGSSPSLFGDSLQVDKFTEAQERKRKDDPKTEDFAVGGDSTKSVNSGNNNCETALLEAQIKELKVQLRVTLRL